ncbi:hypothetical protein MNF30_04190 [Mycoplasma mycoides subsp. capri]|uniref:hypothetical protein n=1 Tax=Mycoplasma mycoides TaxID=2102 RepID=UPI00223EC20A|nr:hypothetical protein [Mycoplasma mycoides]UZK64137.1 hypothetical protein MNF30_04190 [Mycoplasma mycoides subsp. capri]
MNFSTLILNDLYKGFIENKSNTNLEQMKKGYTIKLSNKPKPYTLLFKNINNKDHEHILLFTDVMKPIVLKNHINVVNKENIIEKLKNTDSSFKNVDLELKNNIINNQAVIKLKSDHNLYDDEIKVIFNTKNKFFNDNRYIILLSVLGIGFLIASLGWLIYALIKRNNNK